MHAGGVVRARRPTLEVGQEYEPLIGGTREPETHAICRNIAPSDQIAICLGMSFWKRKRIQEFLRGPRGTPLFRGDVASAVRLARERGGGIAVWATREPSSLSDQAASAGVSIIRVEDGFLRSVGLGSDFIPGFSIVLDRLGIYYDPARPSDLEVILSETEFSQELRARAARLIDRLVGRGLTKYNVGKPLAESLDSTHRRRIFVPGQVDDDCSVVAGSPRLTRNLDLLAEVRRDNPGAFIVYKPHPDVESGHRRGALPDTAVLRFADRVVHGVSSAAITAEIDEVHTLTSLGGFEALLQRRTVVTYGQPFYAGWGLTIDRAPLARRGRRLTLEELVAGALILYPIYLDPLTRKICEVETLIARLDDKALWRTGGLVALRRLQGAIASRLRLARLGAQRGGR